MCISLPSQFVSVTSTDKGNGLDRNVCVVFDLSCVVDQELYLYSLHVIFVCMVQTCCWLTKFCHMKEVVRLPVALNASTWSYSLGTIYLATKVGSCRDFLWQDSRVPPRPRIRPFTSMWSSWNCFLSKRNRNNKKVPIFVTSVGSEMHNNLQKLLASTNPKDKWALSQL